MTTKQTLLLLLLVWGVIFPTLFILIYLFGHPHG